MDEKEQIHDMPIIETGIEKRIKRLEETVRFLHSRILKILVRLDKPETPAK